MTEVATDRLEIKAAAPNDIGGMFAEFMGAFEEFKRTHDGRLAELEKRGTADALTEEKVSRLNSVLDNAKSALDRMALERSHRAAA